mmetsp:Transcript_57915/g.133047  ORF Transcript_57915/g.133047 Transcript_57915/m.133047 type:complete len:221 (-) Transcript_57915:163-825(-)
MPTRPRSASETKIGTKVHSRAAPDVRVSSSSRCGLRLSRFCLGSFRERLAAETHEALQRSSMKSGLFSHSPDAVQSPHSGSVSVYTCELHASAHEANMYCGLRMHSPAAAHESHSSLASGSAIWLGRFLADLPLARSSSLCALAASLSASRFARLCDVSTLSEDMLKDFDIFVTGNISSSSTSAMAATASLSTSAMAATASLSTSTEPTAAPFTCGPPSL